jgi:molybdopterin-guanine dinucleotide biosynthesis protein A
MSNEIYGILLAGGKSSRMGQNKALLPIGQAPLIEHIVSHMEPYCREIVVVTNHPSNYTFLKHVRFVADIYPGRGPLAGIHAGLSAIPNNSYGFVMACDMPSISPVLLRNMLQHVPGPDAVVYSGQPFHSLYHPRALSAIEHGLIHEQLRMEDLLRRIRTTFLEIPEGEEGAFLNLNTPEDYERYRRSL